MDVRRRGCDAVHDLRIRLLLVCPSSCYAADLHGLKLSAILLDMTHPRVVIVQSSRGLVRSWQRQIDGMGRCTAAETHAARIRHPVRVAGSRVEQCR